MFSPKVSVPLSEVIRLALPTDVQYLTQNFDRHRMVQWATVVGVPLRREELITAGDFVIVAVRSDNPNWDEAIREFVSQQVSVAVTNQPIPDSAIAIAEAAGIPLLQVSSEIDLREIHRGIMMTLLQKEAQVAQKHSDLSRHLHRLVAESVEFDELADEMGNLTGHSILIQDKRLSPITFVRTVQIPENQWEGLLNRLCESTSLPDGWSDRRQVAQKPDRVEFQELEQGYARYIAPIVVGGMSRGFVSVIAHLEELDVFDQLAAGQGAMAFALSMSREKAVNDNTKMLRGDFLDAVLAGTIPASELERWANRLGHRIDSPHAVLAFTWGSGMQNEKPSQRRLETIVNGEIGLARLSALVRHAEHDVLVFVTLDNDYNIAVARALAENVFEQTHQEYPKARIFCGIGRPAVNLHEWRTSHREALQSLETARRMDEQRPMYFGDLSVHRLLFQIEDHPELERFCRETIGALADYDDKHNSTLVQTLSIYFENLGNLTQTADALYIHRNTLQYRMERITEIAKIDINNPDTRLAVQLALKAFKLLPTKKEVKANY
jgi:purine catabolism regulator